MRINMFMWCQCVASFFLLAMPAVVQAQFTYTTNNGAVTITGYIGPSGAVVIPASTNGYAVTAIGDYAFAYSTSLTSVGIPRSVTNIGENVFLGCAGLTNISVDIANPSFSSSTNILFDKGQDTLIAYPEGLTNGTYTIPSNVASIGDYAFASCFRLTSIDIPFNVKTVGDFAFSECSGLTGVTFTNKYNAYYGGGTTNIGASAFSFCTSLSNVVMRVTNTVPNIGGLAFAFCTNLASAYFWGSAPPDVGNAFYSDPDAIVYYLPGTSGWDTTFGGVPAIEETPQFEFEYTTNNGSINITGYVGPVGAVGIPESINGYAVTGISPQAFQGNSRVTSITVSDSVISIGDSAFENCENLTNVVVQNGVTNIGSEAFAYCTNLTSALFEGNVPTDDGTAFYADPDAVVYYVPGTTGWGATFGGAPTVMETTPASDFSFQVYNGSVAITSYNGPGGAVFIPTKINGYPVTSIEGEGLSGIFQFDNVTNVFIPNTVTNIGYSAFENCMSLTSITIPGSITSIGPYAFDNCTSLANFIFANGVTSVGQYMFDNCTSLTNVTMPKSVMSIGQYAFEDCRSLTSVTIPGSVTNIGFGAFLYCTRLSNATISNGVPGIGEDAFYNCTGLTSVTIPESVSNIGIGAFQQCFSLSSVTIPASVTSIGVNAFLDCTSMTNFSVDAANSFYSSLNGVLFDKKQDTLIYYPVGLSSGSYIIRNSVINVAYGAFGYCTNLTSIVVPGSVTNIGAIAFEFCSGITSAYFEGNAPPDVGSAFYSDFNAIVYYLPGTIGWGATFGGVPAVLWNPQATAITTTGGQFGFEITGPANSTIVVEACTNLANPIWLPVSTNMLSGSGTSSFNDPQGTNYPRRYYRFSAL